MFPPAPALRLDMDAISQIFGSISIACWIGACSEKRKRQPRCPLAMAARVYTYCHRLTGVVAVVFSPQILENWKRSSADGLSVVFIIVWLAGDFFNIFGAVLQGVLPTMIILAVYYTLADIVLLIQCFWYKGFTLRDNYKAPSGTADDASSVASEQSPLLPDHTNGSAHRNGNGHGNSNGYEAHPARISDLDRRHSHHSQGSFRERYLSIDGTHLSPVTPLHDDATQAHHATNAITSHPQPSPSSLRNVLYNTVIIFLVIVAGIFGWYLSAYNATPSDAPDKPLSFNPWGQLSGYICALLYLGSRVPQLLLNYRRKSTEGISMLFFLFACLGNLAYVLSILVYQPQCGSIRCAPAQARQQYAKYIAVNASWLLGSLGTLLLDAGVFVQYFFYRSKEDNCIHG